VPDVAREPHPWSTGFTWRNHDRPPTTLTADQVAVFDRDGFTVVPDAFDAETLAELDEAITPGEERVRELLASLPGGRLSVAGVDTQTVAPHLVLQSEVLRVFCRHPLLVGICRDLMGDDVRLYWEQAVYKAPHSVEPVSWHQDNGYTFVVPQDYLTCWVAITDATLDNGCVSVVPGVHRDGTLRHVTTDIGQECWGDHDLAVQAPVSAGSIVVFSSLTPHFTGRNRTDEVRKAYIVQYCHDGAVAHLPDRAGEMGPPMPQVDPDRQFPVLRDGQAPR
jgi:ectoine hydroxylase-related dioxygenase (phytanoyl-CoA dioxygenase family)